MDYGTISKSYVSALDPMMDTREINKHAADIYNEDALTDILNWGDRKKPIKSGQPVYYSWVNEPLFQQIIPDSRSGQGTTQVTLVLSAATSGKTKVQDIIKFVDNNVGIVRSVTPASGVDTIVVKSVSGANISVTAADKLAIISVAMGEKSSAPAAARYGNVRYMNKVQIFSETSSITDVQNAATVEVEVNGSNKWLVRDHIEKKLLLKGKVNAAFIGGDMSVTSFSDTNPILTDQNSGGLGVQTTRGLDKYIELYGTTLNTGGGALSMGSVDDVLDNMTAVRAPMDYLVVGSSKAIRKVSGLYKGFGSGGLTPVRLNIDGKEIDLNVEKVTYGGAEFHYLVMPILNHPVLFSQTVISKSLYYIPYNEQVKTDGGASQPSIQIRYIPNQSPFGNDMVGESYDGALAVPNPNGTVQKWDTVWTTTQGLEVLGAQHFMRQQVV